MRAFCLTKGWVSCLCWISALSHLCGCKSTPNAGPVYRLHESEIPEAKTPVAVSIDDRRPDSERACHLGSVDLADYGNAVDILTIDNFDPQPIELLKKSLAAHLSNLSLPPTWAEVDLISFQVVVNRSGIMEVEYARQRQMTETERMTEQRRLTRHYNSAMTEYRKACRAAKKNGQPAPLPPPPPPHYLPPSAAPGTGIGVGLAVADGNGMGGVIGGIGAGLLAAAIVSDIEDQRPAIKNAAAIENPSGVTCKIMMHVRLHWPDGRREVFDIASEAHTPPPRIIEVGPEDPATVLKLSVIPTVELAMKQASLQLATKGAAFLGQQTTKSTAPGPGLATPTRKSKFETLPEAPEELETAGRRPGKQQSQPDERTESGSSRL
jgi:hypothetical protein